MQSPEVRALYAGIAQDLFDNYLGCSVTQMDGVPPAPGGSGVQDLVIETDDTNMIVFEVNNHSINVIITRDLVENRLVEPEGETVMIFIDRLHVKAFDLEEYIKFSFPESFRLDRAIWIIRGIIKGNPNTPWPA